MSYSAAGQSFGQGFGLLGSALGGTARAGGQKLASSMKANKKLWAFIAFLIIAIIVVLILYLGDKYGGWFRKATSGEKCSVDGDCNVGFVCSNNMCMVPVNCDPRYCNCNEASATTCPQFCTGSPPSPSTPPPSTPPPSTPPPSTPPPSTPPPPTPPPSTPPPPTPAAFDPTAVSADSFTFHQGKSVNTADATVITMTAFGDNVSGCDQECRETPGCHMVQVQQNHPTDADPWNRSVLCRLYRPSSNTHTMATGTSFQGVRCSNQMNCS